jgi:sRNA-binding regulator protein Hfq
MDKKKFHRKPRDKSFNKGFKKGKFNKPKKRILTKKDKIKIAEIDEKVKEISNKINQSENVLSNKEPEFRKNNIGKKIILETKRNEKIEGELHEIDKYRIMIKVNDKIRHYYKHSLIGYNTIE